MPFYDFHLKFIVCRSVGYALLGVAYAVHKRLIFNFTFLNYVKMRIGILLVILLLTGRGSMVLAQATQYKFTRIGIDQGLSNNQIKCFLKDRKGFIWIGTVSGLNRYDGYDVRTFESRLADTTSILDNDVSRLFEDPEGKIWLTTGLGQSIYDPSLEKFSRNTLRQASKFNVPGGLITAIEKDSKGNFWFVHSTLGLFQYRPTDQSTIKIEHNEADTASISNAQISSFTEDGDGNFWLIYRNGVVEKMDGNNYRVVYRNYELSKLYKYESQDYNIVLDSDGDVWIFATNSNRGLHFLNHKIGQLLHLDKNATKGKLTSDIVRGIVQDNKGLIWIATDHGGINILNKQDFSTRVALHNPDDDRSLSQNSIQSIYKDYDGVIWIGTYKKGVNYFHENVIKFRLIQHHVSDPKSLPFNDINAFAEDKLGNLWLGTNGGGLIYYDRKSERFQQYLNDPRNSGSLSSNVIVSLCVDRSGKLWIGTYYGGLNCFDGKTFTRYRHNAADPSSIADDNIWEIFEDSQGKIWIGTISSGLDIFDQGPKKFTHYRPGDFNSVHSSYVTSITEDRDRNVWVGTGYGIDFYDRQTGRFTQFLNDPTNPNSLVNNNVYKIIDDEVGNMWIGTKEGLNQYNKNTKSFKVFRTEDGLPHNTILSIQTDNRNNVWVSTTKGLSNLILTRGEHGESLSYHVKNYNEFDGLQGKQFNDDAGFKTRAGELLFSGALGFNLFSAEDIIPNDKKPTVIITGFQLFNADVNIGEEVNGRVFLEKALDETDEITLRHADNVFSIKFAALSFFHTEKSRYQYKLEGFSPNWLDASGESRQVTFTNLDPGTYVFRVRASNDDGLWNDEGAKLKIVVLPPFWKTRIAFVLYVVIILAALFVTRKLILQRERMKFAIEQERTEAQRMHEMDVMKLKFFTNVSHEFRTPLTLILTPLEKILKNTKDAEQLNQFQLIHRNARRLLNLVNQLLDFRKLEVQEIKFNPSEGDIVQFIRETVFSFSDLSEKKDVKLEFKSTFSSLETVFDHDKLEKILLNLLSNAFKFTPEHGHVTAEILLEGDEGGKQLLIKVMDTGIGIPADKLDKIFERFFQTEHPRSMVNQGSGIGLSITAEFVKAHEGNITVTSEVGKGSCFTVTLPIRSIGAGETVREMAPAESTVVVPASGIVSFEEGQTNKQRTLLLVEDNEDFRFYLKDNLRSSYRIVEARNGKEGLVKALTELPDLIVSDVMMPEMNGIELCKQVKSDPRISHSPVILLTARTAEEQKLEGFESGADDYVTKPFNFEILQSRIKNLIHQRELFQKDFRKRIEVKASSLTITSLDEKLIERAIKCVEDNVANPEFSVEDLSHHLNMSRVHLYKKLTSLTGKSPLEFIRTIRLQQAAQLLEKSQLTVSEIAYKVGFNNPKYFARYFKEEYKVLPSAYVAAKETKL